MLHRGMPVSDVVQLCLDSAAPAVASALTAAVAAAVGAATPTIVLGEVFTGVVLDCGAWRFPQGRLAV